MEIRETSERGIGVLCLCGELDVNSAPETEQAVRHAASTWGQCLLLDLSELKYISSGGLGIMVVLQNELVRAGGALALCSLTSFVADVFKTTNLIRRFTVYPSRNEALDALAEANG